MLVSLSCSVVSVASAEPLFNLASQLKTLCPPLRCSHPPSVEGTKSNWIPLKRCLRRALSSHPDAALTMTVYAMLQQGSVDEKANVLQCDWGAWNRTSTAPCHSQNGQGSYKREKQGYNLLENIRTLSAIVRLFCTTNHSLIFKSCTNKY